MTRERFIRIQKTRGYKVEDLGKMVILRSGNYTAIWFFTSAAPDAEVDKNRPMHWTIKRS